MNRHTVWQLLRNLRTGEMPYKCILRIEETSCKPYIGKANPRAPSPDNVLTADGGKYHTQNHLIFAS